MDNSITTKLWWGCCQCFNWGLILRTHYLCVTVHCSVNLWSPWFKGHMSRAFPGIKSACHDLFHGSGRKKSMAPYKRRAAPKEFWK
jgi:hypothetical protein